VLNIIGIVRDITRFREADVLKIRLFPWYPTS
jgi:hypothetical protein